MPQAQATRAEGETTTSRLKRCRSGRTGRPLTGWSLSVFLAASLGILVVAIRYRPPLSRRPDVATENFSGVRARDVLTRILGDGRPHPIGSQANKDLKDRLIGELRLLGLAPEIQKTFTTGMYGIFGEVENIVTSIEGTEPGPGTLVAAHYDSVEISSGASDDMQAIAVLLELGDWLARHPPRRRVTILMTDGEEAGLLGAEAFAQKHPLFKEHHTVLNLDGRGSDGLSILVQTGLQNDYHVRQFAEHVSLPMGQSGIDALYRFIPGDTDFTAFSKHGLEGYCLAFVGDAFHYHTPLDSLKNVTPGALQHLGNSTLALVRALDASPPPPKPQGARAYIDIAAITILHWDLQTTGLLALCLWGLFFLIACTRGRASRLTVLGTLFGMRSALMSLALAGIAGWFVGWALQNTGALPTIWIDQPGSALATMVLAGWIAGTHWMHRRKNPESAVEFWAASTILWLIPTTILAVALPSGTPLFILPATLGVGSGLVAACTKRIEFEDSLRLLSPIAVFVNALLWGPVGWLAYRSLGFGEGILPAILGCLILSVGLPALSAEAIPSDPVESPRRIRDKWVLWVLIGLGLTFALRAVRLKPFSTRRPQPILVLHLEDADRPEAQWLVSSLFGPLPRRFKDLATFEKEPREVFPWAGHLGRCYVAPGPRTHSPPPVLDVVECVATTTGRRVHLRFKSQRGAESGGVLISPDVPLRTLLVNGQKLSRPPAKMTRLMNEWQRYFCARLGDDPIDYVLDLDGANPIEVIAYDTIPRLPAGGEGFARGAREPVTELQLKDTSIVMRRIQIP